MSNDNAIIGTVKLGAVTFECLTGGTVYPDAISPAYNSYVKHFGDRVAEAAEADVLGMAMDALENVPLPITNGNATEFYGRFYDWLERNRAVLAWKGEP